MRLSDIPRKAACRFETGLRYLRSRFEPRSALLIYHRVAEDAWDPFGLCVSPANFESQLAALEAAYPVLAVEDFACRHREGRLEPGSVALSFDDGYLDFAESALPLLEARGLPATLYCVASGLGGLLWWDRLHAALLDGLEGGAWDERGIVLEGVRSAAAPALPAVPAAELRRENALEHAFSRLYPVLKSLPPAERETRIGALAEAAGDDSDANADPDRDRRRLLREEELAQLAAHPLVGIGGHTFSHPCLAALPPEEQLREIEGSLRVLDEIAGRPVASFSYPFGLRRRDYDRATLDAARRAGLDHALAADPEAVTPRSPHFALPRLWVYDEDGESLLRRLDRWLG